MLDLKGIRENPSKLLEGLKKRGIREPLEKVETLLSADRAYRHATAKMQEFQSTRNALARQIGEKKKQGLSAEDLVEQAHQVRDDLVFLEKEALTAHHTLQALLEAIPNLPMGDVPEGVDESTAIEILTWGEKPTFSFTPQPHEVLGKNLGGMDFEAAARISGARFVVLKGSLARLERALAHFMLDIHTQEFGYQEISPPYLVKEEVVYGVGQLPKFKEDLFATTDGRWLISTGEVSLTNLVREQILEESTLPLRYVAYTPCFRSEAGAAGKDTHGMIRLHQFSKVELVHITTPEASASEYDLLMTAAQSILQRLKIPYRVVLLSGGDMGFSAQKTYDLEVWLPSQGKYRETSSCSHCGDFQARRMEARMRRSDGGGIYYVHTLNGSGLAIGRVLVALLENFQQEDGSVFIPQVLQPYMGNQQRIARHEG